MLTLIRALIGTLSGYNIVWYARRTGHVGRRMAGWDSAERPPRAGAGQLHTAALAAALRVPPVCL